MDASLRWHDGWGAKRVWLAGSTSALDELKQTLGLRALRDERERHAEGE